LIRILFTSSRGLETHKPDDRYTVESALNDACARFPATEQIQLVHGGSVDPTGKHIGGDWIADAIWRKWAASWPGLYAEPEVHPAAEHPNPKARNLHMIALGADVCVAIAHNWISGTGHCARHARKAGIPTLDFGVATGMDHSPWKRAA
jgi:hypothetical protein